MKSKAGEQEKLDLLQNSERDHYKKLDKETAALTFETLRLVRARSATTDCVRQSTKLKLRTTPNPGDRDEDGRNRRRSARYHAHCRPPIARRGNTSCRRAAQPLAIHLGSMRPQWVTAPDGSEMLVLVRAAKVDNKTVYQGVVLDWPKLEAALKDEVKDLFPDAKLTAGEGRCRPCRRTGR